MGSADVWWSHVPVVGRAVRFAVLLIVLRLADFMTAVTCADDDRHQQHLQQQQHVHLTELGRNIIKGLKLEKLPDMTKVDISNEEFHCKYLEYFRRLYEDESEFYDPDDNDDVTMAASYDNDDHDVSAIQVRGRVKHFGGDNRDDESPRLPTDVDGDVMQRTATITFPIDATMVRGGGGGRVTVIKLVARIYADAPHIRVHVYGRLLKSTGAVSRETPSFVADLTSGGNGRWMDLDVTRLLRPRKHHFGGDATATSLELSLRYSGSIHFGNETDADDGRHPVLHAFMDGAVDGDTSSATVAVRCSGETNRKKRDDSGRHGRGKKRRRPASSGRVRRTDCKAETSVATGNDNGTEHGGGGGNKCCREQMRVVFADIPGFDFIIEPKWFDAGLCRGRCPAKYNPATRHAFIQSLLWKQHNNRRGGVTSGERRSRRKVRHGGGSMVAATTKASQPPPKPCCAPRKLDRLQIIHVDETDPSSLKVTTWKEMAVVECACS
ncbi:hypothetical protein QTP88_019238 [Uroleucon formosanum]